MFSKVRYLFDEYYCKQIQLQHKTFDEYLAHEVRVRLRQLQYLVDQIFELEENLLKTEISPESTVKGVIFSDIARPDCEKQNYPLAAFNKRDELRLLLESFYYTAHRILDILNDAGDKLPDIARIKANGVRDVRNHLIMHPTKNQGVRIMTFAIGGPFGPQLKPIRQSGAPLGTIDKGFRVNSMQFRDALKKALILALKR